MASITNFSKFWVLSLLVLTSARTVWAADQGDREIVRSYAAFYFEHGQFDAAIEQIEDHLKYDAEDGGAWGLLGKAQAARSLWHPAARSYEQAARFGGNESRGAFLYLKADALVRVGDIKNARVALEEALGDPKVRVSAEEALKSILPRTPLPPLFVEGSAIWHAVASAGVGYDSNVLLLSDTARSSTTDSGTASPSATPALELRYEKKHRTGTSAASLRSSYSYYSSAQSQTYNGLYNNLGISWRPDPLVNSKLSQEWTSSSELNYLNSDGLQFYDWTETLASISTFKHSEKHETELKLPFGYQKFSVKDTDDGADNRSGLVVSPQLTYRHFYKKGTASIGIKYERVFAIGSNYKATTIGIPLNWTQRSLPWGLIGSTGLTYEFTRYTEASTGRRDKAVIFTLSAMRRLSTHAFLSLNYTLDRNLSNVDSAQYWRHQLGVNLIYELF